MQTRTYGDLFKLIQSLAGVGSFSTDEQSDVANFINRRFFEAFQTSPSWIRYIVVGEERTVGTSPAQTIPFTEASKDNIGEFIRIHRKQPFLNNSAVEYDFYVDASGAHILNQSATTEGTAFVTYKKVFSAFSTSSAYATSTERSRLSSFIILRTLLMRTSSVWMVRPVRLLPRSKSLATIWHLSWRR
jgi:hypothetical protein